jgi:hypothetical protein
MWMGLLLVALGQMRDSDQLHDPVTLSLGKHNTLITE